MKENNESFVLGQSICPCTGWIRRGKGEGGEEKKRQALQSEGTEAPIQMQVMQKPDEMRWQVKLK